MKKFIPTPKRKNSTAKAPLSSSGPVLSLGHDWAEVLNEGKTRTALIAALQQWLPSRRWFRSKARTIQSISIREQIPVSLGKDQAFLVLFEVVYTENEPELYVLPLACAFGQKASKIVREWPRQILAHITLAGSPRNAVRPGVLYDAIVSKEFCRALLGLTAQRHKIAGRDGNLEAEPTRVLDRIRRERGLDIEPSVSKAEQSNSSIIYESSVILKFFRRLDPGINPELEIERFLAARNFSYSPALAGALEYHDSHGRTSTVAVLTSFVPGCHDAWEDTLQALKGFYQRIEGLPAKTRQAPPASETSSSIFGNSAPPRKPTDLIGSYLQDARTLGRRTAALHRALASDPTDPAFSPEPWTSTAQKALSQSLQDLTRHNFELLRHRVTTLSPASQALAQKIFPLEAVITKRFQRLAQQSFEAVRIRTHGDYHLGQVLHHGVDFLIIDFEGEPAVSLTERRAKQSAFRDVAGMIYSFFYAAKAALREQPQKRSSPVSSEALAGWARYWAVWVGATFLRAYLQAARPAPFVPKDETSLKVLLDAELLHKAIYELGYELNNRPDWADITFQVLLDLLNPENPL